MGGAESVEIYPPTTPHKTLKLQKITTTPTSTNITIEEINQPTQAFSPPPELPLSLSAK